MVTSLLAVCAEAAPTSPSRSLPASRAIAVADNVKPDRKVRRLPLAGSRSSLVMVMVLSVDEVDERGPSFGNPASPRAGCAIDRLFFLASACIRSADCGVVGLDG